MVLAWAVIPSGIESFHVIPSYLAGWLEGHVGNNETASGTGRTLKL